jgi:putative lipoprotein (rSAM/lipoprotein system)
MKRIRKILLPKYSFFLSLILGIIGIQTGCNNAEYGTPVAEYGTPSAKFIVTGKIESDSTSVQIPNIRVDMMSDTVQSDLNGNYNLQTESFPETQTFHIHFRDVDNSLNGSYKDLDTTITFQNPQFTNGDGEWYEGETTKEFNVKLKPKN